MRSVPLLVGTDSSFVIMQDGSSACLLERTIRQLGTGRHDPYTHPGDGGRKDCGMKVLSSILFLAGAILLMPPLPFPMREIVG